MKVLGSFQTIEHFWRIYDHMIRANDFKSTTDYHLFKDGVKPTWEGTEHILSFVLCHFTLNKSFNTPHILQIQYNVTI